MTRAHAAAWAISIAIIAVILTLAAYHVTMILMLLILAIPTVITCIVMLVEPRGGHAMAKTSPFQDCPPAASAPKLEHQQSAERDPQKS